MKKILIPALILLTGIIIAIGCKKMPSPTPPAATNTAQIISTLTKTPSIPAATPTSTNTHVPKTQTQTATMNFGVTFTETNTLQIPFTASATTTITALITQTITAIQPSATLTAIVSSTATPTATPIVYTCGNYDNGTKSIPCYWTGTVKTDLDGGVNAGSASSIYISGGVMYIGGGLVNGACYWANGIRTDLSGGGYANSIFADNGTVYAAGGYSNGTINVPCYWAGGVKTDLYCNSVNGYANSIYEANGTIYTAGYYYDGTNYVPCVWNGNALGALPQTSPNGAEASSVVVSNGTVYVGGDLNTGGTQSPCYWMNANCIWLTPMDLTAGWVKSIYVTQDGSVYAAGYDIMPYTPCYWAGNVKYHLTVGAGAGQYGSQATSIFVSGGTPYIAGYYVSSSAVLYTGCFWTGATRTDLVGDGTHSTMAFSISVQ